MAWLVVYTKSQKETLAHDHLERQGFLPYCPMLRKEIKYKDGSMASLQSRFAVYSDIKSEYFCEKGFVRIKRKGITPTLVEVWNAAENETEEFIFEYPGADGYNYEAEHVMECLDQRKTESDILPLSFSADLMEVLDRIRQDAGIVFPFEK